MSNSYQDKEITEAALRPVMRGGRRFWVLVGILSAVVALGAIAYGNQLLHGLGVTGLNNNVFWGIYETDLVAFIGISYGGAVVSAILRLTHSSWRTPITRLAEAVALTALPVGALFPIIHLGHPERLWEFLVSPNPASPVLWDLVAIITYLVATILFFYLPLIPDLAICLNRLGEKLGWRKKLYNILSVGWKGFPGQRRLLDSNMLIMSVAIIPLAVSVHSVLSFIFSMTSRTGWHSTIYGPYFVIAALFSGVAAVILVVAAFRKAYHLEKYITEKQFRNLGYLLLTLGAIYLYFTFSEFLTEGYVSVKDAVPLVEALLLQSYAPLFWTFVVGAGVLPVLLVSIPRTRTISGIVTASGLAVAGMWLKRFLIVVPPLRQTLFPQAATAPYYGSLVEIAITLAAAAAIPLLLMLIFRVFPVMSIFEMEEVGAKVQEAEKEEAASLATEGGKP